MRSRKQRWLWAALPLLLAAAYLMARNEPDAPASHRTVSFPRAPRAEETRRMRERNARPLAIAAAALAPVNAKTRDPVLRALPPAGKTALVIEANAIRNSPLGELLIQCLARRGDDSFNRFRDEAGIDLLKDLDRVAISDEGVILSGNLENFRWGKLREQAADGLDGPALGRWRDEIIVVANSGSELSSILGRLDAPSTSEPAIPEEATYGEIYGVLAADELAKLVPHDQPRLGPLRDAVQRVELHVDARDDVAIVAQVRGPNPAQLSDLEKAISGLLSAGRLRAQAEGNRELAELLDLARVVPKGARFDLELALPQQFIERHLTWCRDERRTEDRRTAR